MDTLLCNVAGVTRAQRRSRQRRRAAAFATAVLVLGAAYVQRDGLREWWQRPLQQPARLAAAIRPVVAPSAASELPPPRPFVERAAAPVAPATPLLGEDWAQAALDHLLLGQTELKLDAEEIARLKEIYVYCQNVRTSYESEIAQVLSISSTGAKIRIPPYPEAGARLQQLWAEELAAELGDSVADLDAQLGDAFFVAFKAFGAGAQMIDVQLTQGPSGPLYRIMARLDFADLDQPELGMDSSRLFSTTGTYLFKPETVATGEWRPLARHFPRLPD